MPLDLALTLLAVLPVFLMGVLVYFHDRQSFSNELFFFISLITVFWSIANYFSLNSDLAHVLFWIRLVLFFALPHVVLLCLFIYNFPQSRSRLSPLKLKFLLAFLVGMMVLTVSPLVFSGLDQEARRVVPIPGLLMPLVMLVILVSLISSLILMVKKYREAKDFERVQWRFMLVGISVSYALLILTNFLFVTLFRSTYFVQFGPLFMLPMMVGTGYAVMRHHLLNVKTIATEVLTFIIILVSLLEVLGAQGGLQITLRLAVFSLFFVFGIFLIRSVLKEVEQREKLEILTKELEQANAKLKELDRLKSEFLSFASHQVKAPMAVVKGFATLIYDGTYGLVSDQIKETAKKIKDSADRMIALVNNILNLRKIEEGKMEYHFEELEVIALISEIVDELRPLAVGKQLDLSLENNLPKAMVRGDREKLRQSFQNLIENAIKYTENGGVKVKTAKQQDSIVIKVSDSGRGMDKELLPRLFEQFNRDSTAAKKIEGTGLGLYIAKQFVLAHRGEIGAESSGEGQGSTFVVKLPLLGN